MKLEHVIHVHPREETVMLEPIYLAVITAYLA